MEVLQDAVELFFSFLYDAASWLFDSFLNFFGDIFTGRSISSVGSSILNIFMHGTFDFNLISILETLFGIAFLIFFIKMIIHIVRG